MILYNTVHLISGRRRRNQWVKKFFDIWQPEDHLLSERTTGSKPNRDFATIGREHRVLWDELEGKVTEPLWGMAEGVIYESVPLDVYADACDDAGLYDRSQAARVALFVFWRRKKISWNQRLFLECRWPSLIESEIATQLQVME